MNTIGETSVFIGTTASGMTVETRNLAVFLLRDNSNQITRVEVYNLERKARVQRLSRFLAGPRQQ